MGVVNRQASKRTVLAFAGAGIGVLSQLWIYSLAFDIYGEVQFILSMIAFVLPFASLGFINTTNRFFPYFEAGDKKDNGFLGILLTFSIISFGIFTLCFLLFEDQYYTFIEHLNFDVNAFKSYNTIIFGSLFFAIINMILTLHATNYNRTVIPYVFNVLSWKVFLPILIILYVLNIMGESQLYGFIAVIFGFICVAQFIYLLSLGVKGFRPKFTPIFKANYNRMIQFALYGLFANMGSLLALKIDKIMLRGLTDSFNTGIYSSFVVLAGLILFPYDSIISITAPVVAKSFKNDDKETISRLNIKSSNVLLVLGVVLFLGMCLCLDDLLKLTPNYADYQLGLTAFFFLGIAKTIDSAFGINSLILNFSKYYYVGFIGMVILAFANISLNISLIPIYGMTGAAVATSVSILLYNVFIQIFNYFVFGFQPFDSRSFGIICLSFGAFVPLYWLQIDIHPVAIILFKGGTFLLLIWYGLYYFKLSPEITDKVSASMSDIVNRMQEWRS